MQWWIKLAWLEWQRSVFKAIPNRDFLWLTVLLSLTMILAALLWGSQRGLLNKFVDVSIGYIEGAGIPIWVTADTVEGFNRKVLQQASDFKLHPYREVEVYEVSLLDSDSGSSRTIWKSKQAEFTGWAVSFDDPLWQSGISHHATESVSLPLTVILNKSLFKEHFDCKVYTEKLLQQLPFWQAPKEDNTDSLYCLNNEKGQPEIWLAVNKGTTKELIPFTVIFKDNLPTMRDLAFLFPISTLNVISLRRYYTEVGYYPELQAGTQPAILVKELIWQGENEQSYLEQLRTCLADAQIQGNRLIMKTALPRERIVRCAQRYRIPLQLDENQILAGSYLQITDAPPVKYRFDYDSQTNFLTISCENKGYCPQICSHAANIEDALRLAGKKLVSCDKNAETITIDMIPASGGYFFGFAYVAKREWLQQQVEHITSFTMEKKKIFYIHPTYEDALVRFMFIDEVMNILKIFYSPFFFAFLIILLLVQIGIVVTHRQRTYGIYLAKGIPWGVVNLMVLMQMLFSLIVSLISIVILSEIGQQVLIWAVTRVATVEPFVDHLVAMELDLLPLDYSDYSILGFITLLALFTTTQIVLYRIISTKRQEPALLLS